MINTLQFNDAITPVSEETMTELADALYDLRQIEIGKRLNECITWKEKEARDQYYLDDDFALLPPKVAAGHNFTFPVHPFCIRRSYYLLQLRNTDKESGFNLAEVDKTGNYVTVMSGSFHPSDVKKGKPVNLNYKSYVGEDALPLNIARKGIITKADVIPGQVMILFVQHWYQILREGDWAHLSKDVYLAEEYDEKDGLHYMETVFRIGRWVGVDMEKDRHCSICNYQEVTRYPQY